MAAKKIYLTLIMILISFSTPFNANDVSSINTINGKVIDYETGEPLFGANVMISNTNLGAATNNKGEFIITIDGRKDVQLVVSMVGYQRVEEKIEIGSTSSKQMEFKLRPGIVEMGSIVVTGTNTPHLYSDVPVKTEIINRLSIERKHAVNLAEALNLQTGLLVENECNNCNFT